MKLLDRINYIRQHCAQSILICGDNRLQDGDDGFFEKFGSFLRQKSQLDENVFKTSLAPFSEEEGQEEEENESIITKVNDGSCTDSGLETKIDDNESFDTSTLSSEPDLVSVDNIKENVCMNIDDLYEEILFEIYNNIGCESSDACRESLVEFAKEVFKIPNATHLEISEIAKKKEPPNLRLNVEVIKAENLLPMDSNGLSDPFVTLYLESNISHRYNSSVKSSTLNPIWEEHFSLPITEGPRDEVLIIEVWDFDAAETVKDKVNKLLDVKGVRGLSKLMKEIAVTASSGKHDNELIGRAMISLKSIPVSGLTVWYNLEKGSKTKSRGSVLVNIALSAEKNKNVASQEHKHLLKLLLVHELDSSQVAKYWWSGKFGAMAEAIRTQHAVQSGLSPFDCALSQWHAYSTVHETHKLNFVLFNSILDVLVPVINFLQNDSEDVKTFWEGAKRLLPSCFAILRHLRSKNVSDNKILKTLSEVLDILSKLKTFEVPATIDIFPKTVYGWIETEDSEKSNTIDNVIVAAINSGAKEWMEQIKEVGSQTKDHDSDEEKLQSVIKIIQMVRSDLQRAMEYFDKLFYHKIRVNYSTTLFLFYDSKLMEICKAIVKQVCSNIKMLDVPDDQFEYLPNIDNVNMGTTLFEVYLVLKRYNTLGQSLCPNCTLEMTEFYQWFERGVTHWLDISIIKALNRIQKAIDLDQLHAVDETVKYSSSAVDTLAIFYQIKIFWQQLDWPEIEGSYTFVAKIVNDICRCCVFYAQRMSRRVETITKMEEDGVMFNLSEEWCLAINNMDYIRQSLPSFIKELGTDVVIRRLGDYRTNLEAERCADTIKAVIDNALDTQRNQIVELIENVAYRMSPSIKRFLTEGAEVLHKDSNSMERLMMYLEGSLGTLYNTLNEVNFERVLDSIWGELSIIIYDLIQSNLDKRRPPAFFQNLRDTLRTMISCFKIGDTKTSDVKILSEIESTLELHALETADLIHQYYLERFRYQKEQATSRFGQLTISAQFTDSGLFLNILNARNLVSMDKNGLCDSFVKVFMMPSARFNGFTPVKTAVHNKNCFPLYDEQFRIHLNAEQRQMEDSLILFCIKDKDLFGMTSQYIAECYITFADLSASEGEQILINLCRPEYTDSLSIRALEYRQGDKQAKEFLKKLKNKSYS
ncbi:protein unc-13 homolog 4B isoform X2 [Drosophila hydei]|uniref:Protein unc-13 homolog 4B isoform X2 n=1 Tax=Drosophila hydei TaxID=7224 RepID=A0A6J1LTC3_DROHY|nr:protein unc-13 homolog 4B isoform X2 [Drosophila hydei]